MWKVVEYYDLACYHIKKVLGYFNDLDDAIDVSMSYYEEYGIYTNVVQA